MAVPNLLKLVLHWSGYGEEGAISFWYDGVAGGLTPAQLNTAAADAVTAAQADSNPASMTKMQALLTTSQKVDKLSIYQYNTSPGKASAQGEKVLTLAGSGALSHPLKIAVVASLRTAIPGARHRGRLYMPGHTCTLNAVDTRIIATEQQRVAETAIGLGEAFRTGLESSLADNTITWVVFSPTGGLVTPITKVRVDNVFDVQRRREASIKSSAVVELSNGLP